MKTCAKWKGLTALLEDVQALTDHKKEGILEMRTDYWEWAPIRFHQARGTQIIFARGCSWVTLGIIGLFGIPSDYRCNKQKMGWESIVCEWDPNPFCIFSPIFAMLNNRLNVIRGIQEDFWWILSIHFVIMETDTSSAYFTQLKQNPNKKDIKLI